MKLAGLQFAARAGDVAGNLARIGAGAREAAAAGAALLVAPELCTTGYGADPAALQAAGEGLDGPIGNALAAIAAASGVAVVAGFPERREGRLLNAALFTDGTVRRSYAKAQLWGPHERSVFEPGPPEPCIVAYRGLRLAILICYDVEFPESARAAARAGADALIVPTALPAGPEAEVISGPMMRVRAFENQVFVAYVGLCGADARFAYAGGSHIAAPDGATLARAAADEALLLAELDPAAYAESRARNAYLTDLRVR